MTRSSSRAANAARSAAIALAGVAGLIAPQLAKAAAVPTAAECRAMTDFTQRGLCWDALDKAGMQDQQVVKKRDFGLGQAAPANAAVIATKKEQKRIKQLAKKKESTEVHDLELTIASVEEAPRGLLILTSTDGAIWEQTDGDVPRSQPSPGDTFKVSKGMMGGFMCQVTRWDAVRCQRDK